MLPIASLLGGFDLCEGEHDGDVEVYARGAAGLHALNASEALAAYLDVSAVLALGGAAGMLVHDLADEELRAWLAKLDEFLSCASLDGAVPSSPFAPNVVAAILDNDVLTVTIDEARNHQLKPEGLTWTGFRWWVLGLLDGRRLQRGELGWTRSPRCSSTRARSTGARTSGLRGVECIGVQVTCPRRRYT